MNKTNLMYMFMNMILHSKIKKKKNKKKKVSPLTGIYRLPYGVAHTQILERGDRERQGNRGKRVRRRSLTNTTIVCNEV